MITIYGLLLLVFVAQSHGVIKGRDAYSDDDTTFMIGLTDTVNLGKDGPIGGKIICGGVILTSQWILTAASCAQNTKGMGAIAGMFFTSSLRSDRWQKRQVEFGIIHEDYVAGEPHYDIALLHVAEPFEWTEYVRPAAFPQPSEIPSGEVIFFGYGQATIGYPSELAQAVKRLVVNIMDWNECRQKVPKDLVLDERMVCTQQLARQSFCGGDHGGPLLIQREKDVPLLVGIASWAYLPCGYKNYPNVYTQVSLYLDWINDNMKMF